MTVIIEGSTVSPPTAPPATNTTSIGLLPIAQGLGTSDPPQLGLDYPMSVGSSNPSNPSNPFSLLLPSNTFEPHHTLFSTGQKRAPPPPPAQDQRSKRRKLEASIAQATEVDASSTIPSISLSAAHQGPTNTIGLPIPVPSFDRPQGMSSNDYVKLLRAKIAMECGPSVIDE